MGLNYFYCTINNQNVEVVDGSEKWEFKRLSAPSASVSLWVPESKITAVLNELMTPLQHPLFPFMYVEGVTLAQQLGKGEPMGHTMRHDMCQIDVTYTPWDKTYTEDISMQAKMITLPKWLFIWDNGRLLADGEEPARIVRTHKIRHSYTYLQEIPSWTHTDIGKVNSLQIHATSMSSTDIDECGNKKQHDVFYDPETLLYEGAETNWTWNRYGTYGWQVTTNFSYNPNGWNKWYNAISGEWRTLKRYASGELPDWSDPNASMGGTGWEDFKMYEAIDLTNQFLYNVNGFSGVGTTTNPEITNPEG